MATTRTKSRSQRLYNQIRNFFAKTNKIINGEVFNTPLGTLHSFAIRHLLIYKPTETERLLEEIYIKEGTLAIERDMEVNKLIREHKFSFDAKDEKTIDQYANTIFTQYYQPQLPKFKLFINLHKKHQTELEILKSQESKITQEIKQLQSEIKLENKRSLVKEQQMNVKKVKLDPEIQKKEQKKEQDELFSKMSKKIKHSIKKYLIQLMTWEWFNNQLKNKNSDISKHYNFFKMNKYDIDESLRTLMTSILQNNPLFKEYHKDIDRSVIRNYIKKRVAWENKNKNKPYHWPYICPMTEYGMKVEPGVSDNFNLDSPSRKPRPSLSTFKESSPRSTPRKERKNDEANENSNHLTPVTPTSGIYSKNIHSLGVSESKDLKDVKDQKLDVTTDSPNTSGSSNKSSPSKNQIKNKVLFKKQLSMPGLTPILTNNPLRWINALVQACIELIFLGLNCGFDALGINQTIPIKFLKIIIAIPLFIISLVSSGGTDAISWLCNKAVQCFGCIVSGIKKCCSSACKKCVSQTTTVEPVKMLNLTLSNTQSNSPTSGIDSNVVQPLTILNNTTMTGITESDSSSSLRSPSALNSTLAVKIPIDPESHIINLPNSTQSVIIKSLNKNKVFHKRHKTSYGYIDGEHVSFVHGTFDGSKLVLETKKSATIATQNVEMTKLEVSLR